MLRVLILSIKFRDLQFKFDSERQISVRKFLMANFICSQSFYQKSAENEEITEEIIFGFCFDIWPGTRILASRLISHHTTY